MSGGHRTAVCQRCTVSATVFFPAPCPSVPAIKFPLRNTLETTFHLWDKSHVTQHPAAPTPPSSRFANAILRFDSENSRDPNLVLVDGQPSPKELAHATWLTDWVHRLNPGPSEELLLAARAQHLRRWEIPRETHPRTRQGYLQWRETLKRFHARSAAAILSELGYPQMTVARVGDLILKKNITTDPEGRTLEDALCLVFLEHQFDDLSGKTDEQTLVGALRKAWKKMSPRGHQAALGLAWTANHKRILDLALEPPAGCGPEQPAPAP